MPDSNAKTIALRWPGRCCLCAREMRVGEHARWNPVAHTVSCLDCAAWARSVESPTAPAASTRTAPVAPGVPGASARREYERRHNAREQLARARLGVVGVGLARLTGDPRSTRVWRQGADGEARVAARLTKLLRGSGVQLIHDRRVPGHGHANIDHLAVGPGGVTVIDAKALHGEVRVETVGGLFSGRQQLLRVDGRDRTRLVRGVQRQAEVVRERLAENGLHTIDVRCALCFANAEGLPWLRQLELDGVVLAGPRRVAKLVQRPGTLAEADLQRVLCALAETLAPA